MQTARDVLEQFLEEMKLWELELNKQAEINGYEYVLEGDYSEQMKQRLADIQKKFLSEKTFLLPQERRQHLTFRNPPHYDQKIVSQNEINKKKIEFLSEDTNADYLQYKYTLILENGTWKVDKFADGWMNRNSYKRIF